MRNEIKFRIDMEAELWFDPHKKGKDLCLGIYEDGIQLAVRSFSFNDLLKQIDEAPWLPEEKAETKEKIAASMRRFLKKLER